MTGIESSGGSLTYEVLLSGAPEPEGCADGALVWIDARSDSPAIRLAPEQEVDVALRSGPSGALGPGTYLSIADRGSTTLRLVAYDYDDRFFVDGKLVLSAPFRAGARLLELELEPACEELGDACFERIVRYRMTVEALDLSVAMGESVSMPADGFSLYLDWARRETPRPGECFDVGSSSRLSVSFLLLGL